MPKIMLVHGMRMPERTYQGLHATWSRALLRGLRATEWGRRHPERLPCVGDIGLVYWADLFRGAPAREPIWKEAQGGRYLELAYYALLRGSVRLADVLSMWGEQGEPIGPVALFVDRMVREAARYMNNGPTSNADPDVPPGAFFQVQARLRRVLGPDTRLVIGHSLGSVIAYEGLCLNDHQVDTFISVGSPIATPHLIREPMLARLNRLLNRRQDARPPWPGVRRWSNFYAPADVWSVPIARLAPTFHEAIQDYEVVHGDPRRFLETHKLTSYLNHPELCDEIAAALALAAEEQAA